MPPAPVMAIRVSAGGTPVAIFNREGRLFAIAAVCPHISGPLVRGSVSGTQVSCLLPRSVFDLETGMFVRGRARSSVAAVGVRAESTGLFLDPRSPGP